MADRPVIQMGAAAPPEFTEETDLALARFGGRIVFATDGASQGHWNRDGCVYSRLGMECSIDGFDSP
jgi:hypothetical protein